MDFFYDNHIGTKDTKYYLAMAGIEHFSLTSYAKTLASRYIQDAWLSIKFVNDIESFSQKCVEKIRTARDNETCKLAIKSMKREKADLHEQEMMLLAGEAKLYVTTTFDKNKDTIRYIINGACIALGTGQIVAGINLIAGSMVTLDPVGVLAGALIISTGVNTIEENWLEIMGHKNPIGHVREGFIQTAEFMGFEKKTGDVAFQTVDLFSSLYALGALGLKPEARRLFYYIPFDFQRKIDTMSKTALALKVISTGNKIRVIDYTYNNGSECYN
ncbi:DUF4225 domain-containing protein [Rahnella laticis]|uniref:DUF4225 domain-containing protein n=1 Tax=Rahnella laticis TaxID=2787622 RepID=UPI0018A27A9F|nr:DUF4225 domain-containing protein [Rahnella laticis]MBF7993935.1 DUF4225 domain-containing protein [Rahnella laticis]